MQLIDTVDNDHPFAVLPWTAPDPLARIDGWLTVGRLRAQISAPSAASGSHRLRELLTVLIGTLQAAEVRALAGPDAGYKKAHIGLLRLRGGAQAWRQQHR